MGPKWHGRATGPIVLLDRFQFGSRFGRSLEMGPKLAFALPAGRWKKTLAWRKS